VRWGKKITGDNKTALIAGAMFVAGLHVAIIGRVATADMALVFFCTLAAWGGWELTRPEQSCRRLWWWIFYVALALGFLAKGPIAWLPLGGILVGRAMRKDSFRLPLNETVVGLTITIALVALWGLPAMKQTNNAFLTIGLGEHVLNRSVGVIDSHGMKGMLGFLALVPLYFATFFVSFFPWSTRVPSALRHWWPERKRDDLGWYLLVQVILVFGVFSLVRTKLPHYTMPAFPCLALWLARQLAVEPKTFAWAGKRLAAMSIFILVLMLGFFSFAKPFLLTENVWRAAQPFTQPPTRVGCFGYIEPSLVWKFRSVVTNKMTLGGVEAARNFLTNPPPYILVLPTKELTNMPDANGLRFAAHGLDLVKLKNWELTIIVCE
jgi:4-amino-4-deoxy-L-arabinose transferase-like glycosyltransferase